MWAGVLNGPCPRRVTAAARALYLPPARNELAAAALVRAPSDICPTTRPLLPPPTRTSICTTLIEHYNTKTQLTYIKIHSWTA